MQRVTSTVWLLTTTILAGCYTVNLSPISEVPAERALFSAQLDFPPETASYTYVVRSAAAGAANKFTILVGEALMQYAGAYLRPVFPEGDDATIRIVISGFDIRSFEAHIDARFSIDRHGTIVFDRAYHAKGRGYFAQTVWGGAFAMKSSMRKTTDEALRSLFAQFLTDVYADHANWPTERDN